ncbi:hypothetical protein [uncultured Sulfitobacter sp.]|jgi:hypothetical protein|uniref:hypothetical protein n=1 Tax=uncultured Sulfitobacter sp. TaxID=191468 RepID=UPI0030F5F465
MADNEHTHGNKHLTLDDIQMIIGRAMVDERFRSEFTSNPEATLEKLRISTKIGDTVDEKSVALINAIAEALREDNTGGTLQDALKNIRDSYLESTDGIIRPHCG